MENETNEFEDLGTDEDVPEQEFSDVPAENNEFKNGDEELSPTDFQQDVFLKNPDVGDTITLTVKKVVRNPKTTGKNKTTGEGFNIGLMKKDKTIMRNDIICEEGRYTISAWEIFYKLFGVKAILTEYGKVHGSFAGCKLSITRNYDGSYANKKIPEIMKLLDKTEEEATAFQKEVGTAMKERRLYTVEEIKDSETSEPIKTD